MTTMLFAPGAGAGTDHPWMQAWAERLRAFGEVQPFDYHYRLAGRRAPDRMPKLVARHREQLLALQARCAEPVVLVGKSMGSRVGCHVAREHDVAGLVCFGYPLRSPKGAMRDEVLRGLDVPALFVSGDRDPLAPLDLLRDVVAAMPSATLHVVPGGDHSLAVRKRDLAERGVTQQDVDAGVAEAVGAWLARLEQG